MTKAPVSEADHKSDHGRRYGGNVQGEPEQQRVQLGRDLQRLLDATDQTLELVRVRLPETDGPVVRDWNDRLFLKAFARAPMFALCTRSRGP
jgi:hypothetical protein